MGRPSVREQRREEILSALQNCVLDYGLAETTLAQIANRAGMAPSAINHFIGNRAEVIAAALERSTDYYETLVGSLTDESMSQVLDVLIGDESTQRNVEPGAMVLFGEMLALVPRDPQVRGRVEHALSSLRTLIAERLRVEYPEATPTELRAVSLSLMLLIDNLERHVVLGTIPAHSRRDVRRAADALLATLNP